MFLDASEFGEQLNSLVRVRYWGYFLESIICSNAIPFQLKNENKMDIDR